MGLGELSGCAGESDRSYCGIESDEEGLYCGLGAGDCRSVWTECRLRRFEGKGSSRWCITLDDEE